MWPAGFNNLEELKLFLAEQLNYDKQQGFSFFRISPGMVMSEITEVLGEPQESNIEAEEQQTLQYDVLIDHTAHGKRDHHRLSALFWAFHREPLEIIRLHVDYFRTGEFAQAFHKFVTELLETIVGKFGEPDKKVFQKDRKELTYTRGTYKLFLWSNAEGIRIQIKS